MTQVWVPPSVQQEMVEERRAREARAFLYHHTNQVCEEFTRELKHIDPLLSMVFLPDPMPLDVVAAGGMPGHYNIIREGYKGGPVTYMPVVGENGEFAEPTSRVYDRLRENDWQDPNVRRFRREYEAKVEDARRRREEREVEELTDEMYDRWLASNRTFVSMNRDTPWSQNVAGRRKKRD